MASVAAPFSDMRSRPQAVRPIFRPFNCCEACVHKLCGPREMTVSMYMLLRRELASAMRCHPRTVTFLYPGGPLVLVFGIGETTPSVPCLPEPPSTRNTRNIQPAPLQPAPP